MRVWDTSLIPYLCNKHLGAVWNEGLTLYSIIIGNKRGWKNSPMRMEYESCPEKLWEVLVAIQNERTQRGMYSKALPEFIRLGGKRVPFQSISQQVEVLADKRELIPSCNCQVEKMKGVI